MTRTTVSVCHTLRLIPLSALSGFARIRSRVIMSLSDDPADIKAIPGTIQISTTVNDGKVSKTITFERSDVTATASDLLEGYRHTRLIATYIDESGKKRVSGSPDWPLTLDYTTEGGVFSISLTGEDTLPDGFLED